MRDQSMSFGPGSKVHMHLALDAKGADVSPPAEIRPVSIADVTIEAALWARRNQAIAQAQEAAETSAQFMLAADRCTDHEKKLLYQQAALLEKNKAKRLWADTVIGYNSQITLIFSADKTFDIGQTIDELVDEARAKGSIREPGDGPRTVSAPSPEGSPSASSSKSGLVPASSPTTAAAA